MLNKNNLILIISSFLLLLSLHSCTENANEIITPSAVEVEIPTGCSEPVVVDFLAGQYTDIGDVTITNDEDSLYIHVQTTGNWTLALTHLYVGAATDMPATPNGNPKIGNFPYSTLHTPAVTSYTYVLPLAELDSCFLIAFHAEAELVTEGGEVIQIETAWANGDQLNPGGSWATGLNYCVQSCCEIEAQDYILYGGQTIEVGVLSVINDANNLYISYNTTGCWDVRETHLYVGDAANIPTNRANTPVPGQFPYKTEHATGTTTFTYTIPLADLPSCYVIAAHAAVGCSSGDNDGQTETAWSFGTEFPNTNRWGWYSEYCTQDACN